MVDAPERIWAVTDVGMVGTGRWVTQGTENPHSNVEYVRADLYEDMIVAKDGHAMKRGEHFDTIESLRAELEQVQRERDEALAKADVHENANRYLHGVITGDAEAAERLAGARMVTDELRGRINMARGHLSNIEHHGNAEANGVLVIRNVLSELEAALAEPAGEAEPVSRLYDADALMADGEIQMTAAEDVLAWLIIEKIGVPDDQGYSPAEAQEIIAIALDNTTPPDASAIREAAQGVIDRMFSTYKARNGRDVGIQGDDGEKCWIVHSDDIEALRTALAGAKP